MRTIEGLGCIDVSLWILSVNGVRKREQGSGGESRAAPTSGIRSRLLARIASGGHDSAIKRIVNSGASFDFHAARIAQERCVGRATSIR